MSTKARLLQFINSENITKAEFYRITGLSNGYLDKSKSIGSEKIEIILSCFPKLSVEWLISGDGEMTHAKKGDLKDDLIGDLNDKKGGLSAEIDQVEEPGIKLPKPHTKKKPCEGCEDKNLIIAELWRIISQQRKIIDDHDKE